MVFGQIVGLVALVCAIWVIYDVLAVNKKLDNTKKIIWVIAAIFFSIITAIVYYLLEKR
ncbi:MAG: PLDc N-terminal domain-containing protein [Candidatus Woesearchaeota archaeon]